MPSGWSILSYHSLDRELEKVFMPKCMKESIRTKMLLLKLFTKVKHQNKLPKYQNGPLLSQPKMTSPTPFIFFQLLHARMTHVLLYFERHVAFLQFFQAF